MLIESDPIRKSADRCLPGPPRPVSPLSCTFVKNPTNPAHNYPPKAHTELNSRQASAPKQPSAQRRQPESRPKYALKAHKTHQKTPLYPSFPWSSTQKTHPTPLCGFCRCNCPHFTLALPTHARRERLRKFILFELILRPTATESDKGSAAWSREYRHSQSGSSPIPPATESKQSSSAP